MHTLTIRVEDTSYSEVINFIMAISKNEVEILDDTSEIDWNKRKQYLDNKISIIENGKATFLTIEEADQRLNDVISKYESRS